MEALRSAPGLNEPAFCRIHDAGEQVVSVRVNPFKLRDTADLSFPPDGRVPWCPTGYYLDVRPFFTYDPLLHAGAYYVQEASSMFLEQAIRQTVDLSQSLKVLDLCAAPGGKSTHLLSLLSEHSILVSNEVIKSRASILEENLVKWGRPNCIITNSDPRDIGTLEAQFDVVVVDAPCSGSGLFRRDPETIQGWSTDLVNLCSQRQQRILADVWPALKEGGVLIYSTCSFSAEEDESIASFIVRDLDAAAIPLDIDPSWKIYTSEGPQTIGYRFYPDQLKGEGFFLAAFRKMTTTAAQRKNKNKPRWEAVSRKVKEGLGEWLDPAGFEFIEHQDSILALPQGIESFLQQLSGLYIRSAGLRMGKWSAKELIPDHALALSGLVKEGVQVLGVDHPTALQYLRKEDISAGDLPKGWALVQYLGYSLGWIKQLGKRANNYYPKEWRIRKTG
jgi:16S rRNA C967 or C1407 C5-methylase (RsmB/RsmF family)/NOL1/NOP2/fmu family ribosome biogenesis protein